MYKHLKAFWESQGIDPDEHIGNMWGWTVSFTGLGVLIFLVALYFYRITYYPQDVEQPEGLKMEHQVQKK